MYSGADEDDDSYNETYAEWTDRIRREYHNKRQSRQYATTASCSQGGPSSSSQSHGTDPNLQKAREKMKQKYDEHQKKAKENYNLHKKQKYEERFAKVFSNSEESDSTSLLKFDDIPWPYKKDIIEMKTLFTDVESDKDAYKKYLKE